MLMIEPPPRGSHARHGVLDAQQRSAHVDGHRLVPRGDVHVGGTRDRPGDACVVHQDVGPAGTGVDPREQRRDGRLFADVGSDRFRTDLGSGPRQSRRVTSGNHHRAPAATNFRAMAAPMPVPPPVTSATRPASGFAVSSIVMRGMASRRDDVTKRRDHRVDLRARADHRHAARHRRREHEAFVQHRERAQRLPATVGGRRIPVVVQRTRPSP